MVICGITIYRLQWSTMKNPNRYFGGRLRFNMDMFPIDTQASGIFTVTVTVPEETVVVF
jgi:hypothetical protein